MSFQNDAATISADELRQRLDDPGLTIVDVRPLPAYNGWRRSGEARGGHIPGAVAFPSAWLTSVDDREVERLLDTKGIVPSREVVLYGDEAERVSAVRARLMDLGHSGIRTYEPGTEGDANEKWPGRRAGQSTAARASMILHYCGVDDVRILDGGYDWWVRAGNPLEAVTREPTPVSSFGVQIPLRPETIVDID